MMVPGSNLLGLAMGVIRPQVATYYAWLSNATKPDGSRGAAYAPGVDVGGSFQPVNMDTAARLGLEVRNNHATFFTGRPAWPVDRDLSPDQFGYNGRRWEVIGKADWLSQDGWNAVLLVDTGPNV